MKQSPVIATLLATTCMAATPVLAAESPRPIQLAAELSLDQADKAEVFLSAGAPAPDVRLANGGGGGKMPWLAATLNFFLGGAGYIYNGERVLLGLGLTAGALGLTYAEYVTSGGNMVANPKDPAAFWPLFGSVFVMNTVLAIDAWQEAASLD